MEPSANPSPPYPKPEPELELEGVTLAHRSPTRAACYSLIGIGWGQVYNKQLEKAVLLWIWSAVLAGIGLLLLLLGLLGKLIPRAWTRPPLGDMIADHAGVAFLIWLFAIAVLWAIGIRDAWVSAERINRREVVIRYGMRRQLTHVLASQLLGFIPLVGVFCPPAVVAEAIDMTHQRRGPDGGRLLREGGQAVLEWALTRLAVYAFGAFVLFWLIWWILRGLRWVP